MPGLLPDIDPDGLLEYSVVYTDRALNHMSRNFQSVMRDISTALKAVYAADAIAIVPGSGTFGMEAVARQFATDQQCMVIRNGWFSYRWSQIFDKGNIPAAVKVMKAAPVSNAHRAAFAPAAISDVVAAIKAAKPGVVFAPHVETASGIMLPDDYMRAIADAVHDAGGLFVLDCIASGTVWVDMKAIGVDILISAPQKGWSASPCCAFVMMSAAAEAQLEQTTSTSFACDLKQWRKIMAAYEAGGHAYYATMPTDGLTQFLSALEEVKAYGFDMAKTRQLELGAQVRAALAVRNIASVAAPGFEAPGVVVSYTDDPEIQNGSKFAAEGLQIAAGVPLMCDEPADFKTFRLGLFGLDKLYDVDSAVERLESAFDRVL